MENLNIQPEIINHITSYIPRDKDMKSPTAALMQKVLRKNII